MRFLTNISIKRKLTAVILLTSTMALLVATLALFVFQIVTFRKSFMRDLELLGESMAQQARAVVAFGYQREANELLQSLRTRPLIRAAVIQLQDGTAFAQYGPPIEPERLRGLAHKTFRFDAGWALYAAPIVRDEARLATFYVQSEYKKPFQQLTRIHLGTLAAVFAGSILLTLILSDRLQRVISDPILKLADTAKTIAEKRDYSARADKMEDDEVGRLTDAFNQMLARIQAQDSALQTAHDELEGRVKALQREIAERQRAEEKLAEAHRELVEASRQAGMAEVATGVLHNVGNVLNSVNVSSTLLRDQVRKSEVTTFGRLAELLRAQENNLASFLTTDSKGRAIPQFVNVLAQQLMDERENLLKELELLAKNVEHIKEIVSMQQNYAKCAGVLEKVGVDELVEDALQFNMAALTRHGILVVRQYERAPSAMLDKHKLLQILVNLIHNAKYALQDAGQPDKRLTVTIRLKSERSVEIGIRDNGVGISPENLTRIFAHGYTTRREGHGFGLHSSALAAREMGGDLKAQSAGTGQGALFTLELPLSR